MTCDQTGLGRESSGNAHRLLSEKAAIQVMKIAAIQTHDMRSVDELKIVAIHSHIFCNQVKT